jgi:hypothetical protein
VIGLLALTLTSAAAGTSRLHPPSEKQAGSFRLAQVMAFATRQEIVELGQHYQHLLTSGIPDSLIRDSSLAVGRVYCCGGPNEIDTAMWFYVPAGMSVGVGDLVEVEMGRKPRKSDHGAVNVARRVRETSNAPDSRCQWMPPNDRLWTRILYCDWMEAEGWRKVGLINDTWLKEPPTKPDQSDAAPASH